MNTSNGDFENVENLSPSDGILTSDSTTKSEKGKLNERVVLVSLLNFDVKGNESVTGSPEKPQTELKESSARDVVRGILQDIITDLPLDSSLVENRSLTPALEEHYSEPTLGSSSDNTWKSCGKEEPLSPSQKLLRSLNSTSSGNTFETAADLSGYSLPSSKEVSFTLPLDDFNNTFDVNTVFNEEQESLETVDLNITFDQDKHLSVQTQESCVEPIHISDNTNECQVLNDVDVATLDTTFTAEEDHSHQIVCEANTQEVLTESKALLEDNSNCNSVIALESETPVAVVVLNDIFVKLESEDLNQVSLNTTFTAAEDSSKSNQIAVEENTQEVQSVTKTFLENFSNNNSVVALESESPVALECESPVELESESPVALCDSSEVFINSEPKEAVTTEIQLQNLISDSITATENDNKILFDGCETQDPVEEPVEEPVPQEVVLSEPTNQITNIVVVENHLESKPSFCSDLTNLAEFSSPLEENKPTEGTVINESELFKFESKTLGCEASDEVEHTSSVQLLSDFLDTTDLISKVPFLTLTVDRRGSKDFSEPGFQAAVAEPPSIVSNLDENPEISLVPDVTVIEEVTSSCGLDEASDSISVPEEKEIYVPQSTITCDLISKCNDFEFDLESNKPEDHSNQQSGPLSQNKELNSNPGYSEFCEDKCDVLEGEELLESRLCTKNVLNASSFLFLNSSLLANEGNCSATPVKSLLDSTFTAGICETPSINSITQSSSGIDIEAFLSYESPNVFIEPILALGTIALNVPSHYSEQVLENSTPPKEVLITDHNSPSKEPIAKEILSKDSSPFETKNSIESTLVSDSEESDLLKKCPAPFDSECLLQPAMPTPNMESQETNPWLPDSLNTDPLNGDDNRSVDVNVNPCSPNHAKNNESPLKTVGNHLNSDSVNSSPNKRKNEEDSAFEDFVPMDNSDLVDDHLMEDQVEEIGVAAVSRRSPSRTRVPEPVSSQPVIKQKTEAANKNTVPNESEAGPEVAEFTEEEFRCAAEVFKDPSTFEFLQRAGNTRALEDSALSRLSLYVKFDPLVHQKSPELRRSSTFKKPAPPQKKSTSEEVGGGELISLNTNESPPISRRESDASRLIDFHSPPHPSLVTKATPKMVPVEPLQRIEDNIDGKKLFTEEDMKKALQINELLFQERLIKKDKEISVLEQNHAAKVAALVSQKANLQQAVNFTRGILEESGQMIRQWQEKKELERVESTRERDQALEDLQNVEASFTELHRRYEKIKNVLEGYKQNEEGLRVQLQDTQGKLRNQEQMYEALKGITQEKLESANMEVENAKKAGGSEIAVLRSQLMKAEMKISSLEKSLDQKGEEYTQLTDIYDDLIARVSGQQ